MPNSKWTIPCMILMALALLTAMTVIAVQAGSMAASQRTHNTVERLEAVIFFSDFEGTDGGLVGSLDWEWGAFAWSGASCGSSSYPPSSAYSGTDMWGTVLNDCYNNLGDTSVLSFSIDLSGVPAATLSWWDWYDVYETYDHGEVYVNGVEVYNCGADYVIPTAWEQHSVDLSPYVGDIVTIEFRMWASSVVNRAGWWIDDVSVVSFEPPDIQVSPSLFEETVPVDGLVTQALIISNTGATTLTFQIREQEGEFTSTQVTLSVPDKPEHLSRESTPDLIYPAAPGKDTPPSIGRAPVFAELQSKPVTSTILMSNSVPSFAVELQNADLVSFDTDTPGILDVIGNIGGNYYAGDFLDDDFSQMYAIDDDTNNFVSVDTTTAAVTVIGTASPASGQSWSGMAGDPTDGTLYGASTNITDSMLYTLDESSGTATLVGEITNAPCIIGIAVNASGEMYGLDICNDELMSIDKTTGAGTVIGSIGFDANYAQGMDFDKATGLLYLAAYNVDTFMPELRIADTSTGNTTLVDSFPGSTEIDALAVAKVEDVPWLSESPIAGTVPASGSLSVDVILDATGMATGNYTASLVIDSNDPDEDPVIVPVVMHVSGSTETSPTLTIPDWTVPINDSDYFDLWDYAHDTESPDDQLTFDMVEPLPDPNAGVTVTNHFVYITPTLDWTGQTTVVVQVMDPGGLFDTDDFQVIVTSTCVPISGADLNLVTTGDIYVDDPVDLNVDIAPNDFSAPYSYTMYYGDGIWDASVSSDDPLAFSHTYSVTGTYTAEFEAWNCDMVWPVTDTVQVLVQEPSSCVGLTDITIEGATSGYPGVYTFSTSYQPSDASEPIIYLWGDGGTDSSSSRTLSVGTHTLMVTATNCSALVTDSHTITIEESPVCVELTGVIIEGATDGYTDLEYTFTATPDPADASEPISYTWTPAPDSGQGSDSAHYVWTQPGTYTLAVTATNCTDAMASDSHVISVKGPLPHYAYVNQPWDWVEGAAQAGATISATLLRGGSPIAAATTRVGSDGLFAFEFREGGDHLDILVGDQVVMSGGGLDTTIPVADIVGGIGVGSDTVSGWAAGGVLPAEGVVGVGLAWDLSLALEPINFDQSGVFTADFNTSVDIGYDHLAKVVHQDPEGNQVIQILYPEGLGIRALIHESRVEGVTTPGASVEVEVSDGNGVKGTATVTADETGFFSTSVYDQGGGSVRFALGDHIAVGKLGHAREMTLTLYHVSYVQPWNNRVVGTVKGVALPPDGVQGRVDVWSAVDEQWYSQHVSIGPDGSYGADFDGVVDMTSADIIRLWVTMPDGTQQAALGWALHVTASTSDDTVSGYATVSSTAIITLYRGLEGESPVDVIGTATAVPDAMGYFSTTVISGASGVDIAPSNVVVVQAGEHYRTLFVGSIDILQADLENNALLLSGMPNSTVHLEGRRPGVIREDAPYQDDYVWRQTVMGPDGTALVLLPFDLQANDWFDITCYHPQNGIAVHRLAGAPSESTPLAKLLYLPVVLRELE